MLTGRCCAPPAGGCAATPESAAEAAAMGEEVELFCAAAALGREREREVFAAVATRCAMGGELAARFLGDKLLPPGAASKPGEQAADEISGGEISGARLEALPLALDPLEGPYAEPLEEAKEAQHEVAADE